MSLSPTATEMLFAVGAGDQVVAVDDQSDFPEGVPDHRPVRLRAERRGDPRATSPTSSSSPASPPTTSSPGSRPPTSRCSTCRRRATLDEAYEQIADVGIATGHEDEAADLVADMRADIDELVGVGARARRGADLLPRARRHACTRSRRRPSSASSTPSPGSRTSPMPPIPTASSAATRSCRAEFLVDADPDFVFLADTECCAQTAETARRPPRLRRPDRGRRTATSSSSPTTSPAAGARGSSTSCARSSRRPPRRRRHDRASAAPADRRPGRCARARLRVGWLAGGRGGGGRSPSSPAWRSGRCRCPLGDVVARAALVRHRPHRHAAHGAVGHPPAPGRARPARRVDRSPLAGASYQGVFRNPLADPYLLGAAAGAGLGVTLVIVGDAEGARTPVGGAGRRVRRRARRRRPHLPARRGRHGAGVDGVADPRRRRRRHVPHRGADLRPAAQPGHGPRGLQLDPRAAVDRRVARGRARAAVRRSSPRSCCCCTGARSTCSPSATTRPAPLGLARPPHPAARRRRRLARHRRRRGGVGPHRLRRDHRAAHRAAARRQQPPRRSCRCRCCSAAPSSCSPTCSPARSRRRRRSPSASSPRSSAPRSSSLVLRTSRSGDRPPRRPRRARRPAASSTASTSRVGDGRVGRRRRPERRRQVDAAAAARRARARATASCASTAGRRRR